MIVPAQDTSPSTIGHLQCGEGAARVVVRHLRDALAAASPVEAIVLLRLIADAATLANQIQELTNAVADERVSK